MSEKVIWDPLRRKNVPLTPEERVRQWFISVMNRDLHIPLYMMMSEVGLKYGEGPVRKEFRADIVAFDRRPGPAMVVECKRPDIRLGNEVLEQALRYNAVLDVRYIAITNGKETYFFHKGGAEGFKMMDRLPLYEDIISQKETY